MHHASKMQTPVCVLVLGRAWLTAHHVHEPKSNENISRTLIIGMVLVPLSAVFAVSLVNKAIEAGGKADKVKEANIYLAIAATALVARYAPERTTTTPTIAIGAITSPRNTTPRIIATTGI